MVASASTAFVETIAPSGLMSTDKAAAYLGVKPATLQVWRSTNRSRLAFVKVGGLVRYRKSDLDAFIEQNTHHAAAA